MGVLYLHLHGKILLGTWCWTTSLKAAQHTKVLLVIFFLCSAKHMLSGCYRVASWKAVIRYNKSIIGVSPQLLFISLSLSLSLAQVPGDSPVYHPWTVSSLLLFVFFFFSLWKPHAQVCFSTRLPFPSELSPFIREDQLDPAQCVFLFTYLSADPLFISGDSQALTCKR